MTLQLHPYVIILFASALTTLTVFVIVVQRKAPGVAILGGLLLGTFVWNAAYAMSWSVTGLGAKVFWLKVMHIGVIVTPTLFLLLTLKATRHERWINNRNLILLSIEPAITLLVSWFAFDLLLSRVELVEDGGFFVLNVTRGIWFWINTIYSYWIILLGFFILVVNSLRATSFFRQQYLIILLGSLIPFAASIFTQAVYLELAKFDMAPISFGISSILFAYAVFRHRFIELLPVARSRLIEDMSDGVLVLDAQGRIVDINPAMQGILKEKASSFIGKTLSDVMKDWGEMNEPDWNNDKTRTELRLNFEPSRYMDLRMTPLHDQQGSLSGRIIVFRDITERKQAEKDLRYANDRLQTQLIEIGLLQSQLREQAIRDPLTNSFNRRYLDETLEREISRAEREKYPLGIMMMDIDHFKIVNDTYGHEAGDEVLRRLVDTLTAKSRHGDFACRYGGEEFVLVMPNISLEKAVERAVEMHQAIAGLNIPYGKFNLSITISMGVACYPDHGMTKEELLRAVDQAMYKAKDTGRNRVSIFHPSS